MGEGEGGMKRGKIIGEKIYKVIINKLLGTYSF